ncbi:MAG: VCBS repeat-containing protein [Bryobacteraceae bacterium]|nr:VCBS repeat-containing protein [Bryobacteraceae bacterium]
MRASLSFLFLASLSAADWRLAATEAVQEPIRGAAVATDGHLYTWGGELRRWTLPQLQSQELARFDTAEGGCLLERDVVATTSAGLAIFRAPRYRAEIIDAGAVAWDCLPATLLGHRGILIVHRGMQVRFYERKRGRWSYQEIYSFYTASEQAGLLLRDIDHDGRPDLICGNYWIQSPARLDLPWRLFAINTLNEQPLSASARLAWAAGKLVWAESREANARLFRFTPPADPKLLWRAEALASGLAFPQGLALDGEEVVVGENHGPASRLWAGKLFLSGGWPTFRLHLAGGHLYQIGERGVRRFDRDPSSGDTRGVAH